MFFNFSLFLIAGFLAVVMPFGFCAAETDAEPGVHLDPEKQETAGIMFSPLKPVSFREEIRSFGKVLDIQPLLQLRSRYHTALAEANVAEAALALATSNRNRVRSLVREEILASRELLNAEAQWQSDQARHEAATHLVSEIRREAESGYGSELVKRVLEQQGEWLDGLASRRRHLVLVVMPVGQHLSPRALSLSIAIDPERSRAIPAKLLAPAPHTDDLVQGETWLFEASDRRLRTGMRVNAWIPGTTGTRQGVLIPESSVVWHDGRAWAYHRAGESFLLRSALEDKRQFAGGWFVEKGFRPGEDIVVKGAEMLLSEEFRQQIPDEDDDPN